jgi:hypothetical protein
MPWINLTLRRGSLPKPVQHAVGKKLTEVLMGRPLIFVEIRIAIDRLDLPAKQGLIRDFTRVVLQADYAARALVAKGFKIPRRQLVYPRGATIGVCRSLF